MANFPLFIAQFPRRTQCVKCFLYSILSRILNRLVITNWLTFWLFNRVIRFCSLSSSWNRPKWNISSRGNVFDITGNWISNWLRLTICSFSLVIRTNHINVRWSLKYSNFLHGNLFHCKIGISLAFIRMHIRLKHVLKSFKSNPCLLFLWYDDTIYFAMFFFCFFNFMEMDPLAMHRQSCVIN